MDGTKPKKSPEKVEPTRKTVSDNRGSTRSSQHGPGPGSSGNPTSHSERRKLSASGTAEPKKDEMIVQVDLTDPVDLMKKLEILNLTEEEEDELLEQAYQLNRTLKQELHKKKAQEDFTRSFVVPAPKPKNSAHKTLSASQLSPLYGNPGLKPLRSGHRRQPAPLYSGTSWTQAQRGLHKNPLPPPPRSASTNLIPEPRPPQKPRSSSKQNPEKRSPKNITMDSQPKE